MLAQVSISDGIFIPPVVYDLRFLKIENERASTCGPSVVG